MISFIIIGRNEGWKISNCLNSVYKTIDFNTISSYEIIYVDSRSTDDSIDRAKVFKNIKIVKLNSDINPAIARNVGAKESKGNILYFIDGDMEIIPEFLALVMKNEEKLIYPFISGQYVNYFYNNNNFLIKKEIYDKSIEINDKYKVVTGGLFIIEKEYWCLVNGLRNKYKMSEDIDLGLRLAQKGIKLLRKKETMALHHTISYRDNKRMWQMLFNNSELYGKSMLYRDHLFNKYIYPIIVRNDYSLIFLLVSILLSVYINFLFLFVYFFVIICRSLMVSNFRAFRFFSFIAYFTLRDIFVLGGIFLFFPKTKFSIEYSII